MKREDLERTKKNISNLSPSSPPKRNNSSQNKLTSSFKSKDVKTVLSLLSSRKRLQNVQVLQGKEMDNMTYTVREKSLPLKSVIPTFPFVQFLQ